MIGKTFHARFINRSKRLSLFWLSADNGYIETEELNKMVKKYYKTNCTKVLSELSDMNKKKDELVAEIDKFGELFDAKAMTRTSMTGVTFGGLVLNNYQEYDWGKKVACRDDKHLWTNPDSNNASRPRSSINASQFKGKFRFTNTTDEQIAAELKQAKKDLKALQEKYSTNYKSVEGVKFESFFESIGTNWGDLAFSGLKWFECEGFVYFESGENFCAIMTEILGTEFEQAQLKNRGGNV